MTSTELTAAENELFDGLERAPGDRTFRNCLYRDGVPTPDVYLIQPVRVLFVFREPSMAGGARAEDMRDALRDRHFRPRLSSGEREERRPTCWWNWKAGMFAHAVSAALEGRVWQKSLESFRSGGWHNEVVNRFAYIQIKKVGGGGTSDAREVCAHAVDYSAVLKRQVELYKPHLILGCGVGRHSPAILFAEHIVPGGKMKTTRRSGATWWEYKASNRPRAMIQLWHPARRGGQAELYEDVWSSVREVVRSSRIVSS